MRRKERVWRAGERAAWERYRADGYRLVARNWRSRLGEVDLILAKGDTLVFCEVKARSGAGSASPFEAVGADKRRKLRSLAELFLQATRASPDACRFDVASVVLGPGRPQVHVFEDAF